MCGCATHVLSYVWLGSVALRFVHALYALLYVYALNALRYVHALYALFAGVPWVG